MELNLIATGIELLGTTVKKLIVDNDIVDVERGGKRNFRLNINEPIFKKMEAEIFAQIMIEFEIEVQQVEGQNCRIEFALEGAFLSKGDIDERSFRELVVLNGATAIIGIARGKIEAISANIFNNGKIVIPFVNVIDYYRSIDE